ncbi:unnamed protein product, partial [Trichogramma brassicae]
MKKKVLLCEGLKHSKICKISWWFALFKFTFKNSREKIFSMCNILLIDCTSLS